MIVFSTVEPALPLSRYIKHYWHLTSEGPLLSAWNNRIFPDTCTDIIFNFGDPYINADGGTNREKSFVSGIMQKPDVIGMKGCLDAIGVSLHPGAAFPLFGFPICEIADETLPLNVLWKSRCQYLEDCLFSLGTPEERIGFLNNFFLGLVKEVRGPDPVTGIALHTIYRNAGIYSTAELEDRTGISARQIQRKFREQVGLTPAGLARVVRFKAALDRLVQGGSSLVDIAFDSGYSDQAHFSREVKAFSGLNPSEIFGVSHGDVAFIQDKQNGN